MNPDNFQQAWLAQAAQARLTIDPELLLNEVRRNQRQFTATIFWRDVREVGTGLLMIPVWLYLGIQLALPWTWYLTTPALAWVVGFLLVDRMRQQRRLPESGEPLRQRVENSLAQIDHQIWLLRNVVWWYLLPIAVSILAFFGEIVWQTRSGGWWTVLVFALLVALLAVVFGGVYRLNQNAVRSELAPRREELEALLLSLKDEAPAASYE